MWALLYDLVSTRKSFLKKAKSGAFDDIREMISGRPQLVFCKSIRSGKGLLHYAAGAGREDVLQDAASAVNCSSGGSSKWQRLLNRKSRGGYTPLLLACERGNLECVIFLIEAGGDVLAKDVEKRTALHFAASGHSRVLKRLLSPSTLVMTCEGLQALRDLEIPAQSGCRWKDSQDRRGLTALHIAVLQQDLSCVLELIKGGVTLLALSKPSGEAFGMPSFPSGTTVLHIAAGHGNVAIVQALLQAVQAYFSSMDLSDWEGDPTKDLRSFSNALRQLPYHIALGHNNWRVAQLLRPNLPIGDALTSARSTSEGLGPNTLAILAALSLRSNLLTWLEQRSRESSTQAQKSIDCAALASSMDKNIQCRREQSARCDLINATLPLLLATGSGPSAGARGMSGRAISHGRSGSGFLARVSGKRSSTSGECGICLDDQPFVVIQPCGHLLCCACAIQICRSAMRAPSCPFCRGLIERLQEKRV